MALNGVTNPLLSSLGTLGRPAAPGAGGVQPGGIQPGGARPAARPVAPAAPAPVRAQPSLTAPANALPAEAPAGTDPELWSVLTGEERAYFAKAAAMGPLTYGRVAAGINGANAPQGSPAMRGARLDVRA